MMTSAKAIVKALTRLLRSASALRVTIPFATVAGNYGRKGDLSTL